MKLIILKAVLMGMVFFMAAVTFRLAERDHEPWNALESFLLLVIGFIFLQVKEDR